MVARKGFASDERAYTYPYPVYRSPILGAGGSPALFGRNRAGSMGLTTVIRDYGTEILNAIRENDVQKLKFILEKTLRSDAKIAKLCVTDIKHKPTKKFACPLILAARQEDSRIMKYMMDKGTDPNFVHHTIFSSKRREIVTALHLAVDLGFYDTTEVLLNANADANIYDHNQETPLHIAVKKADHMMMRLLLSKGADPSIADRKANAALHIATLYGHLQMVRTLLKYDADIYQKGQWDVIPPHIAAKEGHIHLIQLFSSNDIANINVKIPCYADRREKAPLHLAAENGHTECLLVLLDQFDADINLKDSDGNTALHCVVLHPYDVHRMRDKEYFTESARVLLKFRISINEKNVFGDTALHFAAMNHYHRIVELLLEMGANPFLENEDNMKPIDTVPDSDPVTKQILKMAMMRGRPTADTTMEHQRRLIDSTMNSGSQRSTFDRTSRSNVSHRSVSSMSSVFVDDVKTQRGHKSRDGEGKRSRSRSKHDTSQSREEMQIEAELSDHEKQEADLYQHIGSETALYSKVDKKKKSKHKHGHDSISNLGYDQQEWEEISATTVNDESVHGSVRSIPRGSAKMMSQEIQADVHRRNRHQQTATVETAEMGTQQDYVSKKNRRNKPRKSSTDNDDMSLDTAIPEPVEQVEPRRVGQPGEIIYENIPPAPPPPPPLPPRKNRPSSLAGQEQEVELVGAEVRDENGVKLHTLPGRPGTIEVEYKGGPIIIAVDTPKEYYEEGVSDEDPEGRTKKSLKHKQHPSASPKLHKKHAASPKVKQKTAQDSYYEEEIHEKGREQKQKQKSSPHKHRKSSDNYEQEPDYYNDYYQQKYVKDKEKKSKSRERSAVGSDPYAEIEQSIDDYFNGTYDISELESLQQSMMSEASQPELIKRIIQQKIAEVTEHRAKEAEKKGRISRGQRTDQEKMQQWLMQTEQDEENDDEDDENILDSDEWEDDMEFQTPDKWLDTDQCVGDNDRQRGASKGPNRSTPLKQKKTKRKKQDEDGKNEEHCYPKQKLEKKPEQVEIPPVAKTKSPSKTRIKTKVIQEPPKPIHSTKMEDSGSHDDDGSVSPDLSPNCSPKPMSFSEKLAWAQALDSGGEGGGIHSKADTPGEVSGTPKKDSARIVSSAELPKWKVNPGKKTTVVESTEQKQISETSEERSRDMDGDDEHEEDSSGISDLTKNMTNAPGMYYSLTQDIEGYSSSSSTTTAVSATINKKPPKSYKKNNDRQEPIPEIEQIEEYEGSPISRHRRPEEKNYDTKTEEIEQSGIIQYTTEPVSPRRRSKSQNDIIDVNEQHRAVSPVNLKDIGQRRGERTASVLSEGRGLGLRVSGDVPKAYNHKDLSSARRAFMKANPAKIESSSECSDTEMHSSRGSLSELGYTRDRGKLWAEPLMKPIYPKNAADLVRPNQKSKQQHSPRSDDSSETENKIIGGYAKPYKSFGKINVKTDLIEEAMLNSSIPEDPECNSDLDDFDISDLEDEKTLSSVKKASTVTEVSEASQISKPHVILENLDKEPDTARYPKSMSRHDSQLSEPPPPLPLNSPPHTDALEEPQLSPRSDTSSRSGRKVVSVREERTNERGEMIQTITTTVIRHEIPHAEVIRAEMVAPTDDLSFGDSTFDDDLDDMVRDNAQVKAPSELPPPPPELMHTDDSQEILEPLTDRTNQISIHVQEVDENEVAQYMKKAVKTKKSKSKKSTENLADTADPNLKKKKKKKIKNAQSDLQVEEPMTIEDQQQEQLEIETYNIARKDPTLLITGHEETPLKPSEIAKILKEEKANNEVSNVNEEDVGMMEYDEEPGSRRSRNRVRQRSQVPDVKDKDLGIMDYDNEPGSRRPYISEKPPAAIIDAEHKTEIEINQSMTDIEVAKITDAAEARRKAREQARAQRQWHKKMLEEGKDPNLIMKSRSHSREASKDRQRRNSEDRKRKVSPSPTRKIVSSSPNSYTIIVEGDAEVTTSRGNLPSQPSPQVHAEEENEGGLISLGSKRGKKKKTKKSTESLIEDGAEKKKKKKKKLGSTDDLSSKDIGSQDSLAGEKKKKKKKKGSRDDLTVVGTGSVEDLAPKGKVQGPPPETVISHVWKEAMAGQPLASSETVYQVPENEAEPVESASPVKVKHGKKKKKVITGSAEQGKGNTEPQIETNFDERNHPRDPVAAPHQKHVQLKPGESPSSMEVSDPSLEHLIKRAVVPQMPKGNKLSYDFDSDVSSDEEVGQVPETTDDKEIKKQQKKLDQLGRKYKFSDGTTVDRSPQKEYEHMASLDRPPSPGEQQKRTQNKHAVRLHQVSIASPEDSDMEEYIPDSLVHRAQVPQPMSDIQQTYETYLDDFDPMDDYDDQIPTMNLTDTQRADMIKARMQKKQQQIRQKAIARQQQLEAEQQQSAQDKIKELQEPSRRLPSSGTVHQLEPSRSKFGMQLSHGSGAANSDDEDDDDLIPGGFVKRVSVPVNMPGQRGIYETSLDSEEPSSEAGIGHDIRLTEAQRDDMFKARQQKKQQQIRENAARQQQLQTEQKESVQLEVEEQKKTSRTGRIESPKHDPSRPKFGIQLAQKPAEYDEDESSTGEFVQRASVPVILPGQRGIYETSLDDSEERSGVTPGQNIQITEEQKTELCKAKEVRRLQQSMDKIARRKQEEQDELVHQQELEEQKRQMQLELAEQARLEAQFENLDEPPRPGRGQAQPTRQQHAIQLSNRKVNTPGDDDSLPESLIKRATVPMGAHKFEISQDDSDDDLSENNQIASISLSDAQKVALAKAREEKRHAKAQEKKERNRRQQEDSQEQGSYRTEETSTEQSHHVSKKQRSQHAVGLSKPGGGADVSNDTDELLPDDMIRRAGIPIVGRQGSYETNLDEFTLGQPEEGSSPMIGLSDMQKAAMVSIREAKRQQKLQMKKHNEGQREVDDEGYLVPQLYASAEGDISNRQMQKPQRAPHAMNLNQPYPGENHYTEIDDPMPDNMIRRVAAPNVPPFRQSSFETNLDDLEQGMEDQNKPPIMDMTPGKHPVSMETNLDDISQDDTFKNAAFSALRKMQGKNQKPQITKKPKLETSLDESAKPDQVSAFSRSASGRIRMKKGARRPTASEGNEIFIDRQPELMGEDALPPDGNTDDQLQQELAQLRGQVPDSIPLMSELWQEKKDQESEMQLMLQSVHDPSELEPMDSGIERRHTDDGKAFRGRLPPPPTEPLPASSAAAMAAITDMNTNQQQKQIPSETQSHVAPGSYKPPRHPSISDRRPPRGPHMNDSLLSNQSSPGRESIKIRGQVPRGRSESPGRPHSDSEMSKRPRSDSEGRSPRDTMPVRRRIRKAYPSEGDLNIGHQSDSEAMKRARRGKSISFYGDFRKKSRPKRDKAPVMKASQSLEEAAWSQIRQDMDHQIKVRPHRVIKPHGDKPINYTRGVYRPTPVYWRGSQRSLANTSRYDDSELIDQLWHERHRSMGTESEGDADLEDMSYDANMPDDGPQEPVQFPYDDRMGSSQFSQSIPDDERIRLAQYNSAPQLPSSAPPYGPQDHYFGAFQPVGPPKKVTIVDKKKRHKKPHKDQKDLPPRMLDPGPVNFNNYGATAKLWMEQVEKSDTQKSKTMYLSTMGDQQPPPEIVESLPTDGREEGDPGAQWVIARGRSLRLAKYEYERQKEMGIESEPDQGPLDPGKQMLLFFKIGENWKDLAWVLFDGLQSDGDTLRMLKEIQHRHPDKVNDQVHDVMHRWWKKKGAAATIEELQRSLEILKMAYVEEEYLNPRGIFSETETEPEPEVEMSTASEDDAEVNRLIHDYKNRSLNGSFENKNAQNSAKSGESNNAVNADSLLKKLEEATIESIPAKINRSSITRSSPQPGMRPRHDDSHEESDFDSSADGMNRHSFIIVQPQLNSKEYKHETNM